MLKRLPMILLSVLVISTLASAQEVPSAAQAPGAVRSAAQPPTAQLANVRLELTIVDQRGDASGTPKTIMMLIEDRQNGRIRTARGNTNLNLDGRPEILREGRIRVTLSLEYAPQDGPDRPAQAPISESITALLEDGKPLVVSQSADSSGDRKVRLEVKATIVK
jgi:hypothetical protein